MLHEHFTDSNILFRLQVASKFMSISNVLIDKNSVLKCNNLLKKIGCDYGTLITTSTLLREHSQ